MGRLRYALLAATVLMMTMVAVQMSAVVRHVDGGHVVPTVAPVVVVVSVVGGSEGETTTKINKREIPETCSALGVKFSDFLKKYLREDGAKKKLMVYNCEPNKKRFCGGTGDRLRGITGLLYLAIVTGRKFEVYSPYPAPLTVFYDENYIKWHRATEEGIQDIPVDMSMMKLQKHKKFMKHLASRETDSRHLRAQSNSFDPTPYAVAEPRLRAKIAEMGLGGCNISCFYGCMFDLLFEPNREAVGIVRETIAGRDNFIGMQVRVSGPMATGLQVPEKWRTHPAAFPLFWEVLDVKLSVDPTLNVFITTDAPEFLRMVEGKYKGKVFSTPGDQFNHTDSSELHALRPDKYKEHDDESTKRRKFQLTLLNNYVLGMGGEMLMAQSGFGDTAFWRTKKTATCIFVNIDTYRHAWRHTLTYPNPAQSVVKGNNSIVAVDPP